MGTETAKNQNAAEQPERVIHLIGNAHIDPVWLWPWTDGFSEVKATFQAALDRIEEYPDFIFTCAGACYYQWVEQNCPALFSKIRQAVHDGRWVPVNGWHLQPDCNIPCGESYARHGLYSQRYYLDKFGIICDSGYNVDSFGHNGMLPQILRLSGMSSYVFLRPGDHEKPGVDNLFYWQSPDGSRLLAYKIPGSYNLSDPDDLTDRIIQVAGIGQNLNAEMMLFYGVGNHGGGPTIALLEQIEELRDQPGFPPLRYSSPPAFMKAIATMKPNLQVIEDDLQYHAIGCYSAMLKIKQLNRRAEQRLLGSERFATLAYSLFGGKVQTKILRNAWEKVMFNQFHDILAGCSLKAAYDDAADFYGYALCSASEVMNQALQQISWSIDTIGEQPLARSKDDDWKLWGLSVKGTPLVVFNPLPFTVTVPVEACGDLHAVRKARDAEAGDQADLMAVTDAAGRRLPIQRVRSAITNHADGKWNTLFLASLPPLGYSTFWLHKHSESPGPDVTAPEHGPHFRYAPVLLADDGSGMENAYVRIVLSAADGGLVSLFDKQINRELLSAPASVGLVIDETHSDTWGHGLKEYRKVIGTFKYGKLTVLEAGPLRGVIRLTTSWGQSSLEQDFHVYCDRPDIEVQARIFWQEKHRMLKIEFPLSIREAMTTHEIPYGFLKRPMDGEEKPIQHWVDIGNGVYGLAVLNDSSHAVDVKDSIVRLTILRGAAYADHYGERDDRCQYMDQGESLVKYTLCPYSGDWRSAAIQQKAMILNTTIPRVYETYHKGSLPLCGSGLAINAANILMTVFKLAEDNAGYILRCYESTGQATVAEIDLPLLGRRWETSFTPCQIKTFYLPFDSVLPVRDVNILELDL